MKKDDIRYRISEYMRDNGIMRTWLADKINRSPTLVTMILDGKLGLTDSNLHKMNVAFFKEDSNKYFAR